MQREIKFRCYWPGVNQMKHFVMGNFEDTPRGWAMSFVQQGRDVGSIYLGKAEVMQFTGLQDSKGVDIYEGDVVNGVRTGSNSDRQYTGVLEWRTDQAGWVIKCGKFILEILSLAMSGDGESTRLNGFEVIGNIYQP